MGEFSLTAIDTLSSLAIMAQSSEEDAKRFWETVGEVVRIYWCVVGLSPESGDCRIQNRKY
jgi:hypothetical protein